MTTSYKLKPFRINLSDLNFMRDQINFRPLFDEAGNAIIAWDGTGEVYDSNNMTSRTQLWNGIFVGTGGTGIHNTDEAIDAFGTSYASVTAAQGLRDVTGQNNNLLLVNKYWGSVDQPFLQTVAPDFASYITPKAVGAMDAFYANNFTSITGSTDYTKDISHPGNTPATGNVVDYTPRMISRLITTGGATPLQDASGQVLHWNAALYADGASSAPTAAGTLYKDTLDTAVNAWNATHPATNANHIDITKLIDGAAIMKDLGIIGMGGAQFDPQDPTNGEQFFGAINPGVAPGNSFLAYFGQFFDHGLDFLDKGGQGTKITIPLATTDPLYRAPGTDGPLDQGNTRITVARANIVVDGNGDPVFDANGNVQWINHTSPYIDQSQTYGSDADITSLLREWVSTDGGVTFHAGAHLLDGTTSAQWTNAWGETTTATLPTLNELRVHLLATGRADLTWNDMGNFRGTTGQALLLDSNPKFDEAHLFSSNGVGNNSGQDAAVVDAIAYLAANALRPGSGDSLGFVDGMLTLTLGSPMSIGPGPALPSGTLLTDRAALIAWINMGTMAITTTDTAAHAAVETILMASVGDHYIAGDGRVNENVGLTTIHHVFHEEHNYQVRNIMEAIVEQDARAVALGDSSHTIAHDWQVVTSTQDSAGNYTYGVGGAIAWDEARLFDAAKLTVEMEYQHAAVDQYARTITPDIPEFVGYNSGTNATVSMEYAQGVFRFGHSTMRETIDYLDPNGSITNKVMSVALEQAFLNPAMFADKGAASIALGLTHQQMNEVDELLTPAMNQGLLGQPLDLAAINIARGRDIGLPTLNDFREGVGLTRYTSWSDFGANMVHPESLVNFIAAYSFDGDVAKAAAIIGLEDGSIAELSTEAMGYTVDQAIAFLNGDLSVAGADGYNHIDTWIGGLAEVHVMGGLLGETFNLVFVDQINRLMDGDRFYYLYRLNNMNLGDEIGNAQLKDIVERNTGLEHLNGSIFAYADQYIDLSAKVDTAQTTDTGNFKDDHKYGQILEDRTLASAPAIGVYSTSGTNTSSNGSIVTIGGVQYIRDIRAENLNLPNVGAGVGLDGAPTTGANSNEVLVGTDNKDLLYMMGGDDTAYGEGGNDIIYGGAGIDRLYGGDGADELHGGDSGDLIDGGAGDDLLYGETSGSAAAGVDQIIGGDGNDIIFGGVGIDKLSGGRGDDVIFGGGDTDAFTHGGDGNDYIDGESDGDLLWGDGGDDLVVGGNNQDIVAGGDGDDILRPGNPSSALGGGPDEVLGGDGASDAGNDGKGVGFDMIDFSDYVAAPAGGVNADFSTQQNPLVAIDGSIPFPAWVGIEGMIGTRNNDTALGDANANWLIGGSGNDSLAGGAGNDVIIGDGIRLDSLIGTYSGTYNHEFDGATHRAFDAASTAAERAIQNNGLLGAVANGTQGFDKHYAEMLTSERFKDLTLGGSTVTTLLGGGTTGDGGAAGTVDVANFQGAIGDYTFARIDFTDAHGTAIVAIKVTDGTPDRDGTDILVGVEFATFNHGPLVDLSVYTNHEPILTGARTVLPNGTEDISYTVAAAALLQGFTDADGNILSVANVSSSSGTVAYNSGTYTITPGSNYNGLVTLSYDVIDGVGGQYSSVAATQTFTLRAVNDAPVAGGDASASGTEDAAAITGAVPAGSDVDGDPLTYSAVGALPAGVSFNNDGTFSVAPSVADQGLDTTESRVVTFQYIANDGTVDSAPATVTVTINGVNDAPVSGGAAAASGTEDDAVINGNVPAATDVDVEAMTYSLVGAAPAGVSFNTNGTFSVAPSAADQGLDTGESREVTFQYVANDGTVDSAPATVTVTINGVNDAPTVAATASASTAEETLVTGSAGASDIDGETLSYTTSAASNGAASIDANGTWSYTPNLDFTGNDSFTITVNDGTTTSQQLVTVAVGAVNDAPVTGGAASASGTEDDALISGAVPVATDIDSTVLTYNIVGTAPAGVTLNANGTFSVAPSVADQGLDTGESREVTFDYVANDGALDSAPATVTVTINGVNDAPVSGGDASASGTEDDALINGAVTAATDVDVEALTYSVVGTAPAGVTFNTDGTFSVAPTLADQGMDTGESRLVSFQYVANDGTVNSAPATVTVTINGVNDAPIAAAASASGTEDDAVINGSVPAATDVDVEALTYSLVGAAPAGVTFNANGTFSVAPTLADQGLDTGESRVVTFQYVANDGTVDSAPATVTVTINGVNDAPTGSVIVSLSTPVPVVDQTLSASNSLADVDGLGPISYQWQSSADSGATWANIAGATSANFLTTTAQLGQQLRVTASYSDGAGPLESVNSLPTAAVAVFNIINGTTGPETINGTALRDQINGNGGNDILNGLAGDDVLFGADGNDVLDGGAGVDQMTGGAGNDSYVVRDIGDTVIEAVGGGSDGVSSFLSTYTLGANVEILRLASAGASDGFGNTLANLIYSGSGNNLMDGGAAVDGVSYFFATSGVNVSLLNPGVAQATGGSGSDTLVGIEDLIGSNFNDTLTGDGNANSLTGSTGNDSLNGGGGNDLLMGGVGDDAMAGGTGDDIYIVDSTADTVIEALGGGTDTVNSTVNFTLTGNTEILTLSGIADINGTGDDSANTLNGNAGVNTLSGGLGNDVLNGNAGIDTLNGGAGNDTLNGGLGNDIMAGGADNDVYTVDSSFDVVTEALNEGTDTVNSSATFTLTDNIEALTLTGSAAINGTGNGGANSLTGNAGINTLTGGAGNDSYFVQNTDDIVIELAGGGSDAISTTVTYTLSDNVEALRLAGTGAIDGFGNAAGNLIYSGAGNNLMDGLGGADWVSYFYAASGVNVSLLNQGVAQATGGSGSDTLLSIESLIGSNFNDTLTGDAGANTLNGSTGNDRLNGGSGSDVLIGGVGNDIFAFSAAGFGTDVVTDFDAVNDANGFDLLDLSGLGITNLAQYDAARLSNALTITDVGADTLLTYAGGSIRLVGVADATTINSADFLLV
jgi:VCBS repeat-containing protein